MRSFHPSLEPGSYAVAGEREQTKGSPRSLCLRKASVCPMDVKPHRVWRRKTEVDPRPTMGHADPTHAHGVASPALNPCWCSSAPRTMTHASPSTSSASPSATATPSRSHSPTGRADPCPAVNARRVAAALAILFRIDPCMRMRARRSPDVRYILRIDPVGLLPWWDDQHRHALGAVSLRWRRLR
jgi:hypothetical protein